MKYYYDFLTLKDEKTTLRNLGHTNRLWQMGQWGMVSEPWSETVGGPWGTKLTLSDGPHQTGWGTNILRVAWPKKIFLRSDGYKKIKVISISLLSSLEDFLQVYFLNI